MSTSGMDRITMLERRCRLLLRAYPAAYRSERGEEIIDTLLETTPEGRDWPVPRDIRSLVAGGLSARAALNRRDTTAANLRVAVLVGVAAYLAFAVSGDLGDLLFRAELGFSRGHPLPFAWPLLIVATLIVATLVLTWLSRRRAIVLAGALPAVAALAVVGPWWPSTFGSVVTELACLALLTVLAGRERPDRRWLWLIGPIVLARLLIATGLTSLGVIAVLCLLPAVAIVSLALLVIDARPAIAIVVCLLAVSLPLALDNFATGVFSDLPLLGFCAVIAAVAVWRLRRQSAQPGRPNQI